MPEARILVGDMRVRLAELGDNSVDAVVTDPPYHLASIVRRFGKANAAPLNNADAKAGINGPYHRASKGFLGETWDGGDVAFDPETWAHCFRVLKPGGHIVAFGAGRNYHRLAVAIEDAGFEFRDLIVWAYGTGFPKSHDTAQGIQKLKTTGKARRPDRDLGGLPRDRFSGSTEGKLIASTGGKLDLTTDDALAWEGWGTALKPALEPVALARKPLSERSVPANVLRWGTGALNLASARVERNGATGWPSNLAHDGSAEAMAALGAGAALFYCAKPTSEERGVGNDHPTVKPVALLAWLVRLVTPPGGLVLDPFLGSGSVGIAAAAAQCQFVGVELKPDYAAIAERRMRDAGGLFAAVESERVTA